MPELTVKGLTCGYNGRTVVDDLSFECSTGGITAVIGPNGSGKTTLLRAISGIVQPESGSVLINSVNIKGKSRDEIASLVSVVPQLSHPVSGFTVKEIVMMGRLIYSGSMMQGDQEGESVVEKAMADAGLTDLGSRDVSTLSGGEFQRTMIARAIAQDTGIILLDEPTSHLDIKYQAEIFDILKKLDGKIILAAMHDLPLASKFCSRTLLMKSGRLMADGSPKEVLTRENIGNIFEVDASFFGDI